MDYTIEHYEKQCDSLYRLVIAATRRASQLSRPDARRLVSVNTRKPTMVALAEIAEGKVACKAGLLDDDDFVA